METSTPARAGNLRRRTLMLMTEVGSVGTPILGEANNDDTERSVRRSIVLQKKASAQVLQSPALNESVKFKGDQDIKEHFQMWSKLHNENKITARIAWQIHIIDLLKAVTKKQSSDTLQVASTSLDIGAKVYGLRVDDIHAEGLKLANSMARFAQKDGNQDKGNAGNDEDGGPEADEEEGRPKQKKRKVHANGPKSTIAKSKESLLANPLPKLDSVFFSTRTDSYQSTTKNLFTNKLPMDICCSKFMVLSKEKWWPGSDKSLEELETVREFDVAKFTKDAKDANICQPFKGFVLDKWNPEEENVDDCTVPNHKDDIVVFDDNGFPVPELDGPVNTAVEDNDADSMVDDEPHVEEFRIQQMQRDIPFVTDLIELGTSNRSEYTYNSIVSSGNGKVIDQIWAGPSHWKLKFLRRSATRYSGAPAAATALKTKRKIKVNEPEPVQINLKYLDDVKRELEELGTAITKFKPKINSIRKVTLPIADSSCMDLIEAIFHLMLRPSCVIIPKKTEAEIEDEPDVANGIVNPDAEHDDMPDHMDHDDFDDPEIAEEVIDHQRQNYLGDNLVEAPEYVPKAYVPYAMQAKKMDMKKLKGFIWQLLVKNPSMDIDEITPTTFSQLYNDLPNLLPENMRKEISCPLAFVALLHLCNEKVLKLTKTSTPYMDFSIECGS